jgi:hypothetical protein
MTASDHLADFSTTDDALVLASVSSKAEFELLNDWLHAQRRAHPDTKVEVLQLPAGDPPAAVVAQLVEELGTGDDRLVVPVRVFWVPGGLPTRVKVVGLISGRDTYRPPEFLQRSILRKDPSRARIVAGEPAKVSELLDELGHHRGRRIPGGQLQHLDLGVGVRAALGVQPVVEQFELGLGRHGGEYQRIVGGTEVGEVI